MEQSQSKSQAASTESSAIQLVSSFFSIDEELKEVDKTLIVYGVYDAQTKNKVLSSLQSISAGILSPSVVIIKELDNKKSKKNKILLYGIDEQEFNNSKIKVREIKIHLQQSNENDERNIRLYEATINGEQVRVVTVPIEKNLIQTNQTTEIVQQIKKYEDDRLKEARSRRLQQNAREEFQAETKLEVKNMGQRYCDIMRPRHLKLFNIEALLQVVRKKTKKISICGLLEVDESINYKQLDQIFECPKGAKQFIIHSLEEEADASQHKNPEISGFWTFEDGGVVKNDCFNSKYYSTDVKIVRTKMYKLMNGTNNEYLSTVIEEFTKTWSNATFSACTCIGTVIKRIYESLDYGQDLNPSFIDSDQSINSSNNLDKTSTVVYTFQEIYQKFKIKDLKILQSSKQSTLNNFFTEERLGNIVPQQKGNIIPESIEPIAFIHFFEQINRAFCDQYSQVETNGKQVLEKFILNYLKSVYELVKSINDTFSFKDALTNSKSIHCENMQQYFDFIHFLLKSSKLINQITNRNATVFGQFKAFFDQLKPKDNRLLTYILNNEGKILANEPIHYYQLLLKIIKQNSIGVENKINYIYIYIHKLKADRITEIHSTSLPRLTQAIRSYSEIIHQYSSVPQVKKNTINKLQIERKVARLLLAVGLPEEAAKIYLKNHILKSLDKCYKQILHSFIGDERAKKLIQFGNSFQSEISYFRAIEYYEMAYEAAKSSEVRRLSIKSKLECYNNMRNPSEQALKAMTKYSSNPNSSEQEFLNASSADSPSSFLRLRNKLRWESKTGEVTLENDNSANESMFE